MRVELARRETLGHWERHLDTPLELGEQLVHGGAARHVLQIHKPMLVLASRP